jgi:hypothetical protein
MLLYTIIQTVLLCLLGLATLYILVFSIASLFYKQKYMLTMATKKIAVLIPGYKEEVLLLKSRQRYSKNIHQIYTM